MINHVSTWFCEIVILLTMSMFADQYRVESGRKMDWNYSGNGTYFVTICTYCKNKFFGKIVEGKMVFSDRGRIALKNILLISNNFSNVELENYVVMPNHIHILLRIRKLFLDTEIYKENSRDVINHVSTKPISTKTENMIKSSPMKIFSLGTVIRWYKARTTREMHLENKYFGWQTRYYDEIIEGEERFKIIKYYIKNNPKNWDKDSLNKK